MPRLVSLARACAAAAVLVVPLAFGIELHESFRLPKLFAASTLGLLSLAALAPTLRPSALRAAPAFKIGLPYLLVALASLAWTAHGLHVRDALASLAIGFACWVAWSIGFSRRDLESLLVLTLVPSSILSLLGILQFHRLWEPLGLLGIEHDARLGVTSLAGNPGDLGAYLAWAALVGLAVLHSRLAPSPGTNGRRRWGRLEIAIALATTASIYGLAVTQTLAAFAAFGGGVMVLGCFLLRPRRLAGGVALAGVAAALALATLAPLRERVTSKLEPLRRGDWNEVLTGRLDGFRAATHLLGEHPWGGVGHGAFRPEYAAAKLDLIDRGVEFYRLQHQPMFANAHNEFLEVGAETGWFGLAALAWGLAWLVVCALRREGTEELERRPDRALAWAGLALWSILALAYFPFRIALTAYPALVFLAWLASPRGREEAER